MTWLSGKALQAAAVPGRAVLVNAAQALKFGVVGLSGYGVNLLVFAALIIYGGFGVGVAAVVAFLFAVANNYTWNRVWTFAGQRGAVFRQLPRFFTVSVGTLAANLIILAFLIRGGMADLSAQATAIIAVAPISFIANKAWSFR